jgi:16S rRNA (cytosine1402-N4)-methyltransferase
MYHNPALLTESIEGLNIRPDGIYIDVTFGGGGHSAAILKALGKRGRLIAFDQDEDARQNSLNDPRFLLINSNFRYLLHFLRYYQSIPVDGILADLGISSYQIDTPMRGFSTRTDGNADMRMSNKINLTAADVLNTYSQDALLRVFREYGELPNAWKIVQSILKARETRQIVTLSDFNTVISSCIPRNAEAKFLAQVYQALRIEVNQELESLKHFLLQSLQVLKPGGRLCVISYHSLEDRLVKNFIRSGNFEGRIEKDFYGNTHTDMTAINRKLIIPSEDEIRENPRSRSAKLRIAEKSA